MSKFKQYGSIKFSPTAVTDKEEVHGLHKRAEGSTSGGGLFVCNFIVDEMKESEENLIYLTCDKTFAEIQDAYKADHRIVATCDIDDMLCHLNLASYNEEFMVFTAAMQQQIINIEIGASDASYMSFMSFMEHALITGVMNEFRQRIEALEAAAQSTTE